MLKAFRISVACAYLVGSLAAAQEPAGPGSQGTQRITGAISGVDQSAHVVHIKEDKTGTDYTVELQNTKSLRKVDPATLDLKQATRITADDLMVGDRVQVFAQKAEDNPNAVAAKALILVSARDLQNVHQEQAAAWQHSTGGVVTQVEAPGGKLSIAARSAQGPKPMVVEAGKAEFTRYSPENPKTPAPSRLADIQVGDQVRVIGEVSVDGSTLTAQRIYSSGMRMIVCTVSEVSADGRRITVKDLQTKQPVIVALGDDSAVRRLPPMMAMGLARRLNPAASNGNVGAGPGGGSAGAPATSGKPGEAGAAPAGGWKGDGSSGPDGSRAGGSGGGPGGAGGGFRAGGGMRNGDVSQLLERIPKITATDLKAGDAVMVAGTPIDNDKSHLLATNVIAGVEPIFQAASPRQMQSLGDWGLGSGAAGASDGMPPQ